MKERTLGDALFGLYTLIISEWYICQGCKGPFKGDELFKGDDGKFYCDGCLRAAEVGE